MGITYDGYWAVETKSGLYILNNCSSYLHISVLLEKSLIEIRKDFICVFKIHNVDADFDSIFPYIDIIKAVFQEGSGYWIALAFNWFKELPLDKKIQLRESLSIIIEKRVISQEIYYRAIREHSKLGN